LQELGFIWEKTTMKRILTPANIRLGVEIVLIIAALFVIAGRITPTTAAPLEPAAPAAPSAVGWYQCVTPNQVAVFLNRVHVHCTSVSPTIAGVTWFAVPTAPDSAAASRFMSLFQSAVLTNQPLLLFVDPNDTSGTSFGCGSGDCRRLQGAELQR
jgi:hypothetical protein